MKSLFEGFRVKEELFSVWNSFLKEFRRPLYLFREVPPCSFWTWTVLTVLLTLGCGLMRGILLQSPIKIILAVIYLPFVSLAFYWALSISVHQVILRIFKKKVTLVEIASRVYVALIPYWLLFIFSGFVPEIIWMGHLATYVFLAYGLGELFSLNKKFLFALFATVYLVLMGPYFFEGITRLTHTKLEEPPRVTEESIKVLEEEF